MDSREAFEAWARTGHHCAMFLLPETDVFTAFPQAWAAWQAATERAAKVPPKLWLWKNFVDGRPEYWAFDNPFPIHMDDGDPQTLGEPCGYALFKPSRPGRSDISDDEVLRRIAAAIRKGE